MNLAAIDLNVLVALDAILSEASVTRAAARIGRSQPATSHALNRARELFGDPLLVRMRGALQLTPRARGLAPRIRHALAALASTMETQGSFRPADVDSVTIGATDYVGFVLLPHLIKALQREAPSTSVRVRTIEGRDALEPVAAGLVDVALGTFPHVPAGLRAEALFDEQFVCLLRKGHPRRGARLSIDQYARLGHVLVTSPWDGRGPVDDALERLGRHRKIAAYVPHFLVAPTHRRRDRPRADDRAAHRRAARRPPRPRHAAAAHQARAVRRAHGVAPAQRRRERGQVAPRGGARRRGGAAGAVAQLRPPRRRSR